MLQSMPFPALRLLQSRMLIILVIVLMAQSSHATDCSVDCDAVGNLRLSTTGTIILDGSLDLKQLFDRVAALEVGSLLWIDA